MTMKTSHGLSESEVQARIDAIGGTRLSDNGAYEIWFLAANKRRAFEQLAAAMERAPDFSNSPQ